jgi:hypothetical protein
MHNKLQLLAIVAVLLFFPKINYSQAPNLGTAASFAVFTTVGALGNTGTSNITGDIGTNNGAITGFGAPTIVNGNIDSENSVTAQCALDVQAAYNEIFGYAPTVVGHAPAFGSGETLPAGVYAIGAAGSVAGNLTLDAAGDTNAIFIFQFGGAFTTGASTTINLINGALACNVFWIAEGEMAMAAITDMKGTLISNNGAVSMGAGGTLEGRMLSTAGAAAAYEVLITLPICSDSSVLPIGLLNFSGLNEHSYNSFSWSTSTEINNDYFTLEKAIDAVNFEDIVKINGAGNSNTPLLYSIIDYHPTEGLSYYRLKQTDVDGKYTYSKLIAIDVYNQPTEDFSIYPTPFSTSATIAINDVSQLNNVELKIYNVLGEEMMTTSITKQITTFDTSNLSTGIYFYQITDNNKTIQSGKLIAQQ